MEEENTAQGGNKDETVEEEERDNESTSDKKEDEKNDKKNEDEKQPLPPEEINDGEDVKRKKRRTVKTPAEKLADETSSFLGSTSSTPSSGAKRARKSATQFRPENYEDEKYGFKLTKGRGDKLETIEVIRNNINSYTMNSEEIHMAHKLLFSFRGGARKRDMKSHLLNFNGYLSQKKLNETEKERDKLDNAAEKRVSIKAYKLNVADLKLLCDMFDVDRSVDEVTRKMLTKDQLIDRLLDFLSEPKFQSTKTYAKNNEPISTSKDEKKESKNNVDDNDDNDEKVGSGMPNDSQLRKWVKAYVDCFNLDKATTKHAVETASDKFGVDLSGKKKRIKELLAEEM